MVLGVISIVGCAISIFALILTIIFHLYVWRYVQPSKFVLVLNNYMQRHLIKINIQLLGPKNHIASFKLSNIEKKTVSS